MIPGCTGRHTDDPAAKEETEMATVIANMSMSIDGFIADPDDGVEDLFTWYGDGPVEVTGFGSHRFLMHEPSASVLRDAFERTRAFLVGRRLYDHTNGWNGRPPVEAPMVVVTHDPPEDWPRDGVPITFVSDGIEHAVAEARELAGDGVVGVAGAAVARECLAAGLLDEVVINLVPVVMGRGIPFFAGVANAPVRFEDPEVIEAPGVTHLRYRVRR
jgi:dihydrofolate reductase